MKERSVAWLRALADLVDEGDRMLCLYKWDGTPLVEDEVLEDDLQQLESALKAFLKESRKKG